MRRKGKNPLESPTRNGDSSSRLPTPANIFPNQKMNDYESLDLENKRKTLRSHQFWFPTAQRCGKLLFPTKIVSSAFCLFCFVDRRAPFPELPFIHFYYIWRSQLFFVHVTKSPGSKFLPGAHNTPSSLTSRPEIGQRQNLGEKEPKIRTFVNRLDWMD